MCRSDAISLHTISDYWMPRLADDYDNVLLICHRIPLDVTVTAYGWKELRAVWWCWGARRLHIVTYHAGEIPLYLLWMHVIDNEIKKRRRMFNMQITRLDEEIMPFVRQRKREYIFGGICGVVTTYFTKVCFFPFCFICIVVFGCLRRINAAWYCFSHFQPSISGVVEWCSYHKYFWYPASLPKLYCCRTGTPFLFQD